MQKQIQEQIQIQPIALTHHGEGADGRQLGEIQIQIQEQIQIQIQTQMQSHHGEGAYG